MEENNEEMVTQVLELDTQEIDEAILARKGTIIKRIMKSMFGGPAFPAQISGNPSQLAAFASVLGKEKSFMDAFSKLGLDNPQTYKSRSELDSAVKKFERVTKLKWPFK
tara:strand:- start:61 stop:387 length:327 start_codon:yes stop_codon:yes gene_type:complete